MLPPALHQMHPHHPPEIEKQIKGQVKQSAEGFPFQKLTITKCIFIESDISAAVELLTQDQGFILTADALYRNEYILPMTV